MQDYKRAAFMNWDRVQDRMLELRTRISQGKVELVEEEMRRMNVLFERIVDNLKYERVKKEMAIEED